MASKKIALTEFYRTRNIPSEVDTSDIEALCKEVMRRKPKAAYEEIGERAMLVLLSDWQAGKNEGGGSEALAERVITYQDRLMQHLKNIHKKEYEYEYRHPENI